MAERGAAGSWDWLARRAATDPDRPYWLRGGTALTFGELDGLVDRTVGTLVGAGVHPGDRVATLMAPGEIYLALLFAAIRAGAVLVPLNPALAPAEQHERLAAADPRLVVADPGADVPQGWPVLSPDALADGTPRRVLHCPTGASPQCVIFTSGTSGTPKGAVLTLSQHYWAAVGSMLRLGHDPADAWLLTLPLFHVGGQAILLRAMLAGVTVRALPRFNAEAVAERLTDGSVTLASLVPTMLERVLSAHAGPFSPRLRAILVGGGRALPTLLARAHAAGLPVRSTYGMTETASQAATLDAADAPAGFHTSGRPLDGVDITIRDPGADGIGEICVRGPQVIRRYWGDEEDRPERAWFATGDLGRLDAAGRLEVVDRRTDLIVTGGENVYPAEVERVLADHPDVAAVAVVGAEDAVWGQRVVAFVELRPGAARSDQAWAEHAARRLARYKVPRRWVVVERLPLTANGKVWRERLREWAEAGA
jgi:O-succinylbenzoic acid--CoA ligase